jgi:hypothetical protein
MQLKVGLSLSKVCKVRSPNQSSVLYFDSHYTLSRKSNQNHVIRFTDVCFGVVDVAIDNE